MGNTNFQTIHQMGTAISDFVKQATGRDNVQNIDMDHITVAQNHRYEEVDVSGRVVSFQAGEAGIPFEKMVVQIKPVQDLHGYDHPWPAGGGVNKFDPDHFSEYMISGDNRNGHEYTAPGTYAIKAYGSGSDAYIYARVKNSDDSWSSMNYIVTYSTATAGAIITLTPGQTLYVYDAQEHTESVSKDLFNSWKIQVVSASSQPSNYAPYSNICPITGWTMVNVYQSGQNMEDARVYRFPFPSEAGIVYGGTLDVTTGMLKVDRAEVDLGTLTWTYNSISDHEYFISSKIENMAVPTPYWNAVGNIVSSIYKAASASNVYNHNKGDCVAAVWSGAGLGVYDSRYTDAASFKTAMNGVQLVYELATHVSFTLSASQVQTILGQNHIWADTGDIEVKFTNVKELY